MKALILGAGYGTKLMRGLQGLSSELHEKYRSSIEGKPKPLVPIAGMPLIEYLLGKIERETDIDGVYVVTNHFFYPQFEAWQRGLSSSLPVHIVDDGSISNEMRLGWTRDMELAVRSSGVEDDWFILAGDTLFEMDFGRLISYFREVGSDVISVYREDWSALHKRGVVVADNDGRVVQFFEKSSNPPTNLVAPISYVLTRETISRLPEFVGDGYDKEHNIIERLINCGRHRIYTFLFLRRYDIGSIEDYISVDEEFKRRERSGRERIQ